MIRHFRRLSRLPSKLRRIIAANRLRHRYASEDPGAPPSDVPIEVLIPVIAKDLPTLPLCIESIRRFVKHPVRGIRLITRPDAQMAAAATELGVEILDEDDLLSPEARALEYRVDGVDRSGWIKQQLIKLNGDQCVGTDRFLVVDADTCFVRNMIFCRDGKDALFCGDEYFKPYFHAYRRLTGLSRRFGMTFVAHHMLFNTGHLRELKETIEAHTHRRWDLAILDNLDPNNQSCFSEYEMYGNFCFWLHAGRVYVRYWNNRSASADKKKTLDEFVREFGSNFFTVSQHSYSRTNSSGGRATSGGDCSS